MRRGTTRGLRRIRRWYAFFKSGAATKSHIAGILSIGVLQSCAFIPTMYLLGQLFDVAIPDSDGKAALVIGAALIGLSVITGLLYLWQRKLSVELGEAAVRAMREAYISRLYQFPRADYALLETAQIHSRIVQETERLNRTGSLILSSMIPGAITSIVIVAALWIISWQLTVAAIVLSALVMLLLRVSARAVSLRTRQFQRDFERFDSGVSFVLRQMELTRLKGYEHAEAARQHDVIRALEHSGIGMAMSYAVQTQIQKVCTTVVSFILLIAGSLMVISDTMSFGNLLVFYIGATLLRTSINAVGDGVPEIISGESSFERLEEFEFWPREDKPGRQIIDFQGTIEVDRVTFGYGEEPVIQDLSLSIGPGKHLVVRGANGSGKSTLIALLLGFHRPQSGQISADGVPLELLDVSVLRRSIGVVPQHPTVFFGSVADNIGYGWPSVSREEIVQAASRSGADAFIARLPQGYDTRLGDGGARLSGGELQKLAIARALIGNPRVLILDEPTNHLDASAVAELVRSLAKWNESMAIVTISHDAAVIDETSQELRIDERSPLESVTPRLERNPE